MGFKEFINEVWKHPVTGQPVSPDEYLAALQQMSQSQAGRPGNPIGTGEATPEQRSDMAKRQQDRQMATTGLGHVVSWEDVVRVAKQMGGVNPETLIAPSLLIAMKGKDPKGGSQHAYPFYKGRTGKIYRYAGV